MCRNGHGAPGLHSNLACPWMRQDLLQFRHLLQFRYSKVATVTLSKMFNREGSVTLFRQKWGGGHEWWREIRAGGDVSLCNEARSGFPSRRYGAGGRPRLSGFISWRGAG